MDLEDLLELAEEACSEFHRSEPLGHNWLFDESWPVIEAELRAEYRRQSQTQHQWILRNTPLNCSWRDATGDDLARYISHLPVQVTRIARDGPELTFRCRPIHHEAAKTIRLAWRRLSYYGRYSVKERCDAGDVPTFLGAVLGVGVLPLCHGASRLEPTGFPGTFRYVDPEITGPVGAQRAGWLDDNPNMIGPAVSEALELADIDRDSLPLGLTTFDVGAARGIREELYVGYEHEVFDVDGVQWAQPMSVAEAMVLYERSRIRLGATLIWHTRMSLAELEQARLDAPSRNEAVSLVVAGASHEFSARVPKAPWLAEAAEMAMKDVGRGLSIGLA